MCVFARLGGNAGLEISLAAFAVTLKFSDSVKDFEKLSEQVGKFADEVSSDGA